MPQEACSAERGRRSGRRPQDILAVRATISMTDNTLITVPRWQLHHHHESLTEHILVGASRIARRLGPG